MRVQSVPIRRRTTRVWESKQNSREQIAQWLINYNAEKVARQCKNGKKKGGL